MRPSIGLLDAGYCGSFYLEVALRMMRIPFKVIHRRDILSSAIEDCSVLVFGAGGIHASRTALGGDAGKERLRALVREGRTYVGICAGAYLAFHARFCLGITDLVPDQPMADHLFQGFLNVRTAAGTLRMWYQNGPVFPARLPADQVVAWYDEDQDEAEAGSANRLSPCDFCARPAIVRSRYGKGDCILLSVHPELGSLGIPGYLPLLEAWRQRRGPNLSLDRLPLGLLRQRFLAQAMEERKSADKPDLCDGLLAPLAREASGPHWRFLADILLAEQGAQ